MRRRWRLPDVATEFLLSDPRSPAFAILDGLLGNETALEALASARDVDASGCLRAAGMGRADGRFSDTSARGDRHAWLSHLLPPATIAADAPAAMWSGLQVVVDALVDCQRHLAERCPSLGLMRPRRGTCEVQLAIYPADGARYVRHLDAFSATAHHSSAAAEGLTASSRRITAIYYLNDGWDCATHGGALRLFAPHEADSDEHVQLVEPILDRLVLFRSDRVPHEVLPTAGRERIAVTLWMHGVALAAGPSLAAAGPSLAAAGPSQAAAGPSGSGGDPDSDSAVSADPSSSSSLVEVRHVLPVTADDPPASSGRIFVTIPAYREPDIAATLQSVFFAARDPDRVRVGLCVQASKMVDPPSVHDPVGYLLESERRSSPELCAWLKVNVRVQSCASEEAAGPIWARHLCESMWRGEDFVLAIDAHVRLARHWDDLCIDELHRAEERLRGSVPPVPFTLVVVSSYPADYRWPPQEARASSLPLQPDPDGRVLVESRALTVPTRIRCTGTMITDGFPRFAAVYADEPTIGAGSSEADGGWAAGCSFARHAILRLAPANPALRFLFFGEESITLARLRRAGAHVVPPSRPVCVHRWSRAGRPSFREHASAWRTAQAIVSARAARFLLRAEPHSPEDVEAFLAVVGSDAATPWDGSSDVQDLRRPLASAADMERRRELLAAAGDRLRAAAQWLV